MSTTCVSWWSDRAAASTPWCGSWRRARGPGRSSPRRAIPGIAELATCVPISANDLTGLADFAVREKIDLTVVGPEIPLSEGIVDLFQERGLRCFGPTRAAAVLESSKVWSKDFFARHDLPTGYFATFDSASDAIEFLDTQDFPLAVKADGLAAGKGVTIAQTREQAIEAINDSLVRGVFGDSGRRVVIEEFLRGPEISVMAISDGQHLYVLPPSQDHKQINDHDQGPEHRRHGRVLAGEFLHGRALRGNGRGHSAADDSRDGEGGAAVRRLSLRRPGAD